MKLADMFLKSIDRPINGVIKVMQTDDEKTSQVIKKAMGGVLFIDEAYALGNNSDSGGLSDYGKEAIDTLVKAMEDYRGKYCVTHTMATDKILAGSFLSGTAVKPNSFRNMFWTQIPLVFQGKMCGKILLCVSGCRRTS